MGRGQRDEGDRRRLRRSSLLAGVGDGVVATALALLAAGLTSDPLSVATVFAAQHLPWAVVAVAGRTGWVDADRRTVLGLGITLRAVAVAAVGLLTLAGAETVLLLVIAALAVGTGETLADQAETDAGAEAEPGSSRDLSSLGQGGMLGVGAIGLPLGGLVYEVAAALPFLLDIGVFALAALAALSLRAPLTRALATSKAGGIGSAGRPARAGPGESRSLRSLTLSSSAGRPPGSLAPSAGAGGLGMRQAPSAGLSGLSLAPGTAVVTGVAALSVAAASAVSAVLVLFAVDDLGLGAPAFGLLLAGLAGAATVGALGAPTLASATGLRGGLAVALAVSGAGYAGAGLIGEPTRPVIAALALGVGAAGSMAAAVLVRALLHVGAGRVVEGAHLAAFHARVWGSIPLGALLGGVAAGPLGVPSLFVVSGVLSVAVALAAAVIVPGQVPAPARSGSPERKWPERK